MSTTFDVVFVTLFGMSSDDECCLSIVCFFLMIRRPPRSTQSRSSAASDVYKRQNIVEQAQRVDK